MPGLRFQHPQPSPGARSTEHWCRLRGHTLRAGVPVILLPHVAAEVWRGHAAAKVAGAHAVPHGNSCP
eukprot:365145-Chlamydomonas_euryale.AAC.23